jgi:hypothetical protein
MLAGYVFLYLIKHRVILSTKEIIFIPLVCSLLMALAQNVHSLNLRLQKANENAAPKAARPAGAVPSETDVFQSLIADLIFSCANSALMNTLRDLLSELDGNHQIQCNILDALVQLFLANREVPWHLNIVPRLVNISYSDLLFPGRTFGSFSLDRECRSL